MTPVETAWLAGLFEGEGTLTTQHASASTAVNLRIAMTDEDVIRRCASVTGMGRVYGPYAKRGNRKDIWCWTVSRLHEVEQIVLAIRPYLGARRALRADEVLARTTKGDRRERPVEHGTMRGYDRHWRNREAPCGPCREASRLHAIERRRRARTGQAP